MSSAGAAWEWVDFFGSLLGPGGVVYEVVGFAEGPDLKRLLNGRSRLIEHESDSRRLWPSARLNEYAEARAITRGSHHVVDPVSGMTGILWSLRSRDNRSDRPLLLDWACQPD